MLSDTTLAFAEEVTRAVLGVDALWQRLQQASGDEPQQLVVLNMSRHHMPRAFRDTDDARATLHRLHKQAQRLPEADRAIYYQQFVDSTIAFTDWLDGNLAFNAQLPRFLHVPSAPVSDERIDGLRQELRDLFNALNYDGDLRSQAAAWEERNCVPRDEVAGVLTELMDEAWERTNRVIEIPASKDDGMRPVFETGVPYNARCDYSRREVGLNIDPVLTRPALKHLAVHECYPGHYLQFKLGEVWYEQGIAPADMLLSVVNTASSCTFEGIADVGMEFIGWVEDDNDRAQGVMNRYRAAIATRAAWRLHHEGWSSDDARDELRSEALVGGDGWVDNRMRFISAPERSALIWSYWWGEELVAPAWRRLQPTNQPAFFTLIYGGKHSPSSLASGVSNLAR